MAGELGRGRRLKRVSTVRARGSHRFAAAELLYFGAWRLFVDTCSDYVACVRASRVRLTTGAAMESAKDERTRLMARLADKS